ncbi:MAG: hypothetical protein GC137_00540 [Alphaproteobacteria bacterium]|nr:hypothetical protein [Alphaproteobacteria bacterium]
MDILPPDLPQFVKLVLSLAIVVGLMGGFAFLLKKLGIATEAHMKSGQENRLKIIESIPLDARRRLVIIRRDNQDHLVILGPNSETVLETNIPAVDQSHKSKTPP